MLFFPFFGKFYHTKRFTEKMFDSKVKLYLLDLTQQNIITPNSFFRRWEMSPKCDWLFALNHNLAQQRQGDGFLGMQRFSHSGDHDEHQMDPRRLRDGSQMGKRENYKQRKRNRKYTAMK